MRDAVVQSKGNSAERIEKLAVFSYMISVAFSPLGPVVHYSLWTICLSSILVTKIKYRMPLSPQNIDTKGKWILLGWGTLCLWTVAMGLLTFHDLDSYGRNVTTPLEVLLGMYLAARLLGNEAAREKFIRLFVWASVFIMLGNLSRELHLIGYFPNRSLENGNSLGLCSVLLLPPLVCYAFWRVDDLIRRLAIVMPVCVAVFLSFSLGAWGAAAFGGAVLLYWMFRFKKIKVSLLLGMSACLLLMGAAFDWHSGGALWKRAQVEYRQITSTQDVGALTTYRNEIWSASACLIRKRPMTGWGGMRFVDLYQELFRTKADELGLKYQPRGEHPHSTLFNVAFLAGIPGLMLFLAVYAVSLKKAFRLVQSEGGCAFPWGLSISVLLLTMLVYALSGDVLVGRRDISVMFWCFWGILLIVPEERASSREKS
ncbi:MAG: O-antigen ligase family protein [Pyramidobacter sp.]|uniref:O-antigen ligase family protein n=1 Tax=Pyramidobacter sp. TaxID=1943581 RepID=UPI002A825081|nr:O-antigen ligase family protein [Pyramidobacter sp.]MDY4033335.1 O-antigen ligase family protein [Pyramidobacter sp.]